MMGSAFGPEAWAPLAAALMAYAHGEEDALLTVHTDAGPSESMPVSLFFRSRREFRDADAAATGLVRGRILDVGACAGAVSLALQEAGWEVTALEVIPEGVEIMRRRGVKDVREGRVQDFRCDGCYDTALLLMNGTALAGTLHGFPRLLEMLDSLLAPGGQILLDSSDLASRLEPGSPCGQAWEEDYPGELQYQLEFRGSRGAPFPQLFLDPETLGALSHGAGWEMEVVWRGGDGHYLARLERRR